MTAQATATHTQTIHIEYTEAKTIKCTANQDIPAYNIKKGDVFLLRRVAKNTYIIKRITILSRDVHADGSITFAFANAEGKRYSATLRRNKQHECGCDAT